MNFSRKSTAGIVVYLVMYFIALALLTLEVFRLYGEINQTFIQGLLANLEATDYLRWILVLAIVPLFFFWFLYLAVRLGDPRARPQMLMCIIPLAVFLIVGFYAILALMYMAVVFIGIYMGGVGSAVGGYQDAKGENRLGKYIPLIGVIVGMFIEVSLSGLIPLVSPLLTDLLNIPLPSQDVSANPSGYGLGYYITVAIIFISLIRTTRSSLGLRGDISSSGLIGGQGGLLRTVMNPLFVLFWVLSAVVLWPLLPFVFLNWGLAILYCLGWITGRYI